MHARLGRTKTLFLGGCAILFVCGTALGTDTFSPVDTSGVPRHNPVSNSDSAQPSAQPRPFPGDSGLTVPSIRDSSLSATPAPTPPRVSVFDTLVGPLPDRLKADSVPYLVIGDIEVPLNKTVTVEPGAILLFKNFTGISVLGKLIAIGTKERPIVFTSENDHSVNLASALYPNPYDWNGIYIHSDGQGTYFAYCIVSYSVYGIRSDTKFIRLDPVKLRYNGKSNLVIEGKEYLTLDKPFSYVLSTKDATVDGIPAKLLRDPLSLKRNIVRFSAYTVALGGIAGALYSGVSYLQTQKDLRRNDPLKTEAAGLRAKRDGYFVSTVVYGILGSAGVAGFWWSFTF
jgi:hypothetical protein